MKRVAIVVILVIGAAVLGLWRSHGGMREGLSRAVGAKDDQAEAREEIRKSFELQPGARIEVQGINGKIDIQTSDTKIAEVYVVRTAGSRDSLTIREVTVEQTATGLLVKSRQVRHGFWQHLFGTDPREDVTIKAPRQIALALKGINGRVTTGDIEGSLEAKGINGRVELGQSTDSAEVSGINGDVSLVLTKLGSQGARVSGVNGAIELKLASGLNADLIAHGMNGSVRSELSDVNIEKDQFGSHYSARIGSGGAPINISGINGNVRLTRAVTAGAGSDKKANEKTSSEAKTQK
jgi:hypothetical protein